MRTHVCHSSPQEIIVSFSSNVNFHKYPSHDHSMQIFMPILSAIHPWPDNFTGNENLSQSLKVWVTGLRLPWWTCDPSLLYSCLWSDCEATLHAHHFKTSPSNNNAVDLAHPQHPFLSQSRFLMGSYDWCQIKGAAQMLCYAANET